MNIRPLILTFGLFLVFFACSSEPENLNESVKQPSATPILEISTELVGWWSVQGEMLTLRLYNFGIAEYEDIDRSKAGYGGMKRAEDVKVRKQIEVSDADIGKILDLLETDEFLNLRDTYIARRGCTDTSVYQTIRFQLAEKRKQIKIYRGCLMPDAENFPDYPPILSKLSDLVSEIMNKASKTK